MVAANSPLALSAEQFAQKLPPDLLARPQWVAWRYEQRDGRQTKVPYSPVSGHRAESDNPATWGTFDGAFAYHRRTRLDGIGFVLAGEHVGVDLDHCRDPLTGEIEPWAREIVTTLNSYTEISPSGTGLHILALGKLPPGRRRKGVQGASHPQAAIEAYDNGRYFTVTSAHLPESPFVIERRQTQLDAFHAAHLANAPKPAKTGQNGHVSASTLDDAALLEKACQASNGAEFQRLWTGDWTGHPSQSEADQALCNKLAFWAVRDAGRMDALFRQSGLMRPKWDRSIGGGQTYGEATISKAVADCDKAYGEGTPPPVQPSELGYTEAEIAGAITPQEIDQESGEPILHTTDWGNAQRLVRLYGRELRYCYPWTKWLVWDGRRWAVDESGEIVRKAKHAVHAIHKEAARLTDDKAKKRLFEWAYASEGAGHLHAMIELARSEASIPVVPEQLDRDQWTINCLNGTLDLRTGVLRPHQRGDLLTKLIPVNYRPGAPRPLWERFLEEVLPDPEVRDFVQRAAGYSLTGDISEHAIFILYGSGRNGKSTFTDLVQTVMADYAMTTPAESLMVKRDGAIPNDIAALRGARFVSASETEEGKRLAEGQIKEMTGGTPIRARFLRQEYFEFMPTFKIWLTTNHKPDIRGTDPAIWERVNLIPFTTFIPKEKRDPQLSTKLHGELEGILSWLAEGCFLYQVLGLCPPEAVRAAVNAYRGEMDVLQAFIEDCCEVGDTEQITAKELYAEYTGWCKTAGEDAVSKTRFGLRLAERGFDRARDRVTRYWLGIGLKAPNP